MTLVLLITCFSTPYIIAFGDMDGENTNSKIFEYTIDALFFADILVIFNTVYYTDDFELVDDRGKIAKNYVNSWFVLDFMATMPFDLILMKSSS